MHDAFEEIAVGNVGQVDVDVDAEVGLGGDDLSPPLEATGAHVELGSWPVLPIFEHLQSLGQVSQEEMLRTFNMGVGLIVVVPADKFRKAQALLCRAEEKFHVIGRIIKSWTIVDMPTIWASVKRRTLR